METHKLKKRNVTTSDVIKIMSKEGREVSEKQAEKILDFLYLLADIVVKKLLKEQS